MAKCEFGRSCIAPDVCPTKGCVIGAKFDRIEDVAEPMMERLIERFADQTEADLDEFMALHRRLPHRYNPDVCPPECAPDA